MGNVGRELGKATYNLYSPYGDLAFGEALRGHGVALRDRLEFKTVCYGSKKGFGN